VTPDGVLCAAQGETGGSGRKRPSVRRSTPYPVKLAYEDPEHLRGGFAVLVREAGTGATVRPGTIYGRTHPAPGAPVLEGIWEDAPQARKLDPEGRRPRRVWLMSADPGWPWPDAEPFRLQVSLDDRPDVEKVLRVGDVRRAMNGSRPVTVTVPPVTYRARWVEVQDADGHPVPYARLHVATKTRPRSILADDRGRAFLGRIPASDVCRIVVIDGKSGAGGEIPELCPAKAPEVTTLRLETPRVLRFRVRREDGAVPGGLSATLVDRAKGRAVAPRIPGRRMDDNLIVFPAAPLGLYTVLLQSRNTRPVRIPATEVGEMVVLD
jgi:hypothetical protein